MTTTDISPAGSTTELDVAEAWHAWTRQRDARLRAPHGHLALTTTVWLDATERAVEGVPGRWSAGAGGRILLAATAADGLLLAGEPVVGKVELRPDTDDDPQTLAHGDRKLVPILRQGRVALRVYDPAAPRRAAFRGLEHFEHGAGWVATGLFTPFPEERVEQVPNADGAERELPLGGEVAFELAGSVYRLAVSVDDDRSLTASFGDATNGPDSFGFRFLALAAPAADGTVVVDFNRAFLPPCAFNDHSLCPLPPAGNRLPIAVAAGERRAVFEAVRTAGAAEGDEAFATAEATGVVEA